MNNQNPLKELPFPNLNKIKKEAQETKLDSTTKEATISGYGDDDKNPLVVRIPKEIKQIAGIEKGDIMEFTTIASRGDVKLKIRIKRAEVEKDEKR